MATPIQNCNIYWRVPATYAERADLQNQLKRLRVYSGAIDGQIGSGSIRGVQLAIQRFGGYSITVDGVAGSETARLVCYFGGQPKSVDPGPTYYLSEVAWNYYRGRLGRTPTPGNPV